MTSVLMAQLALFQGLLLIVSAAHKTFSWQRSRAVARHFAGIPGLWAAPALAAVIVAELVAAGMSIAPSCRVAGSLLAALLWAGYLLLIGRAILADRRDLDCGCSFGTQLRPLGAAHVVRNALLAGVALTLAAVSAALGSEPAQASQWLGGIALLVAYGAWDQVMALQPLRSGNVL